MASRFWVGGTGSWITGDTTHWSATSGGSAGATVPTTADDVFFDSLSGLVNGTIITVDGTATANNVTIVGTAFKQIEFSFSANVTFNGNLSVGGNTVRGVNRLHFRSGSFGNRRTITVTGGTITITGDIDFLDIAFTGVTTWTNSSPSYVGDGGNNGTTVTNNRTAPAAQAWSGTAGGNWSANAWSGRVPLPQDPTTISAAFAASQTITFDMPRIGAGLDFTGCTGSPAISNSAGPLLFGSLILSAGVGNYGTTSNVLTLTGRGSHVITSAGKDIGNAVTINCGAGTYTLSDNMVLGVSGGAGRSLVIPSGTFNTAGKNIWCAVFASTGTLTRAILNLTGTITLAAGGGTQLNIVSTGLTADFSTANFTIVFSSGTGQTSVMNIGGGISIGSITCIDATNNHLNFQGSLRLGALNIQCSAARTVTIVANQLLQVNQLTLQGGASPLSIVSGTPGTKVQLAETNKSPARPTAFTNVTFSADIQLTGRRSTPVMVA
jgi:hypothetical protein